MKKLLFLLIIAPFASAFAQVVDSSCTLNAHAMDVSPLSGGDALAAEFASGALFVKSLEDPAAGFPVRLARVEPTGAVVGLQTFGSVRNSNLSGIAVDPATGGIIVADEIGGDGGRIALVDLTDFSIGTLFDIPWTLNPGPVFGTGQQQFAPDPVNTDILYFWDSTRSILFSLDRSTNALRELHALDTATPDGEHSATFTNDIAFDPSTGTVLLTDGLSNSVFEVDPSTDPATVTTLFSGLASDPRSIALDPVSDQVFVSAGGAVLAGPRSGGALTPLASNLLPDDIVVGLPVSSTSGRSLFAVNRTQDVVYELNCVVEVPIDIKPGADRNCFKIDGHGMLPVVVNGSGSFDVTQIDPESLRFGGLQLRIRGNRGPFCAVSDVNGDAFSDLLCQFEDDAGNWEVGDGIATLTGKLFDGTLFEGADEICVVP